MEFLSFSVAASRIRSRREFPGAVPVKFQNSFPEKFFSDLVMAGVVFFQSPPGYLQIGSRPLMRPVTIFL
jgi:hypothetical protein